MSLSGVLREECMQIGAEVGDKLSVLKTVAGLAKKCTVLADIPEETILGALKAREELGSTGFGKGIAIPHCTLDQISDFVVGILSIPDGVDFESLDGEKAKLFVFIVGPSSERNRHISVLAAVSRALRIPGATDELLAEKDPVAVRESFLRYSRDEVDTTAETECCLFHVFVQIESKFYDILQVFTAMESCTPSVIEAKDATEFLHKLPLFSSFWKEDRQGFNRIITAVVQKSLANDTIRQINDIAGGLDKNSGIMIAVDDIFFTAGSLNS